MNDLTPVIEEGVVDAQTMSFPTAMKEIRNGKKIRRIVWPEKDYGVLQDGFLMVFTDNKLSKWLVNDGDIDAEDFVVITETN